MSLPGNIIIKLSCGHIVNKGFVFDLEEWAAGFQEQEIICPICEGKGRYSRKHLLLTPAKTDPEE